MAGKVYRLRQVPGDCDRLQVAKMVSKFITGGSLSDVEVASLAPVSDRWAATGGEGEKLEKVATLSFSKLPDVVHHDPKRGEWELEHDLLPRKLLLDDSFIGLTPLNDVPDSEYRYDCIVLSGLASHPMGSWQPHGSDKSYMWVRDTLPSLVKGVRFYLYGYDTKLVGSKSFQGVHDLSRTLIDFLESGAWAAPGPRNLAFFAHSLGGVVLKKAFLMAAGGSVMKKSILDRTSGVIFFGVPSQGLDVSDMQIMLGDQPNKEHLVKEISTESNYLERLERQFSGIALARGTTLLWAYETHVTASIALTNGVFKRDGPGKMFVTPASATGNRCKSDPAATFQIEANHSDMIKLSPGNEKIKTVALLLEKMLKKGDEDGQSERSPSIYHHATSLSGKTMRTRSLLHLLDQTDPSIDPSFWNLHAIKKAIHVPERDSRVLQIEKAAGHSFAWAFENPSIGLTDWLQGNERLFWIQGKPASGKSTLMKFLYKNPLMERDINQWRRRGDFVRAASFFHHRGTPLQKSFEGLLRGLLSQILEQAPRSFPLIVPVLEHLYREDVSREGLGSLSDDLQSLVDLSGVELDSEIEAAAQAVLDCEVPRRTFRARVAEKLLSEGLIDSTVAFENLVFSRHNDLSPRPDLRKIMAADKESKFSALADKIVKDVCGETHCKTPAQKQKAAKLIRDWLFKTSPGVQLSHLKRLLISRIPPKAGVSTPQEIEVDGAQQLDKDAKIILRRFVARQSIRHSIENMNWTPRSLRQAFDEILQQQVAPLDLFFLIDALDEFDGTPKSISDFIKNMVAVKGDTTKTKIKVLFSSRPWDPFIHAFGQGPGFRIHDFTENDIQELCVQTIHPDMPGSHEILKFTREIVKKAKGVFLWARLVLDDLAKCAARSLASGDDVQELHMKLRESLDCIPREMKDYYGAMIERIPRTYRLDAFCLLEAVSKSTTGIRLQDAPSLVRIFHATYLTDMTCTNAQPKPKGSTMYSKDYLAIVAGGLIEIVKKGDEHHLQLLHQTLKEFLTRVDFKRIILEDRDRSTEENGHSILAKYMLWRFALSATSPGVSDGALAHHAREAERTTGNSLYQFFQRSSEQDVRISHDDSGDGGQLESSTYISLSLLEFASWARLKLLANDVLQKNEKYESESESESVARCRPPARLFQALILPLRWYDRERESSSDGFAGARDMLLHLFGLSQSLVTCVFLEFMMHPTWMVASQADDPARDSLMGRFLMMIMRTLYGGVDHEFSVQDFQGPDFRSRSRSRRSSTRSAAFLSSHQPDGTFRAIHICDEHLARHLLDAGADANTLTSHQLTPLDCHVLMAQGRIKDAEYEAVLLLKEHGARLNACTRKQWNAAMGYPVGFVLIRREVVRPEGRLPTWLEGAPGCDVPGKITGFWSDVFVSRGSQNP